MTNGLRLRTFGIRQRGRAPMVGALVTPRSDGVNRQLFDIFYAAAGIDAVKREHPGFVE